MCGAGQELNILLMKNSALIRILLLIICHSDTAQQGEGVLMILEQFLDQWSIKIEMRTSQRLLYIEQVVQRATVYMQRLHGGLYRMCHLKSSEWFIVTMY